MIPDLHILPIKTWLDTGGKPLVIAGPCSAESEGQVMETAFQVKDIPLVRVFRAGVWKPRTRPNAFEGVGTKGLKWLERVKAETGLLTTVEVANPVHVSEALKHHIDILWVGARTVVNPFSVQEIADALRGVDIPVMVKNPLTPDIATWVGALERFNRAGITKLLAVHRGFSYFRKTLYRNAPMWEIPIELKRFIPDLPVIADPSHICGKKDLLQSTSQRALDLEMDGLMIEIHPCPSKALTDAHQQITPKNLAVLLSRLVYRERTGNKDFESRLEELRQEIDKLDWELIDILARRMDIVKEIGKYKRENNITILQLKRWKNIIENRIANGEKLGLEKEFLLKLLGIVHDESIQKQTEIMNENKS